MIFYIFHVYGANLARFWICFKALKGCWWSREAVILLSLFSPCYSTSFSLQLQESRWRKSREKIQLPWLWSLAHLAGASAQSDLCLSLGLCPAADLSSACWDLPCSRGRDPILSHILFHFPSDDPDAGQSWQENLPSEFRLSSFCVFFLTQDWSILNRVGLASLC